jgi:hypothetical protein
MAPRKFVRISMIIDHTKIYDVLALAEGNALAGSLEIVPVRHGGEKENGELEAAPNLETFVNTHLAEHGRIHTKSIVPEGAKHGFSKGAIYARIKRMLDSKLIKRVGTGTYVPTAHKAAKAAKAAKKHKTTKPKAGNSASDLLVKFVAQKQNGSGAGVALSTLKEAMEKKGFAPTGVGPALTTLVANKKLVRVGFGEYRLPSHEKSGATAEG